MKKNKKKIIVSVFVSVFMLMGSLISGVNAASNQLEKAPTLATTTTLDAKGELLNIPDYNFRKAIWDQVFWDSKTNTIKADPSGQYLLYDTDLTDVQRVLGGNYSKDVAGEIKDFTGVEYLVKAESLRFTGQTAITSLDLNALTKLKKIECGEMSLTSIKFDKCVNLEYINCKKNNLKSMDVSMFPKLDFLRVDDNPNLKEIDVSHNPLLDWFACYRTQVSELNLSNNPILTVLYCNSCELTSLDVSNNKELTTLYCFGNHLLELDLSNNSKLTTANYNALEQKYEESAEVVVKVDSTSKKKTYEVDLNKILPTESLSEITEVSGEPVVDAAGAKSKGIIATFDKATGKAIFNDDPGKSMTCMLSINAGPAGVDNKVTMSVFLTNLKVVEKKKVTFEDESGNIIKESEVTKGDNAKSIAPKDEEMQKDGYKFLGWDSSLDNIDKDMVFKPLYAKYRTIIFEDENGNIIKKVENVIDGDNIQGNAPEAPVKENYEFIKWDQDLSSVSGDLVIKPVYKKIENTEEKENNTSKEENSNKSEVTIKTNDSTSEPTQSKKIIKTEDSSSVIIYLALTIIGSGVIILINNKNKNSKNI